MTAAQLLTWYFPDKPLPNIEITALTERAEHADRNSVLVCIKGARHDGHDHAAKAYQNGCRIFVAQKPLTALPNDAAVITVKSTRRTLADLACRFYGAPSRAMQVIGITGTKGKTTTAQLLRHILDRAGIPCGYIGTNGIAYGAEQHETQNTTPDAVTLQRTLLEMLQAGMRAAVVEVSSQALMQYRADGTRFAAVLFTNFSPDHIGINEHPDLDHYKACKKRLFTDFEAPCAIVNADDPSVYDMLDESSAKEVVYCSARRHEVDFFADEIEPYRHKNSLGVSFTAHMGNSRVPISLPLIGKVNAENAMLAMATAKQVFGVPLATSSAALSDARVMGRSEVIPLESGACAVIDYAHNGESMTRLLSALRAYVAPPHKLTVLFGSVGERSQLRRAELGRVAAAFADLAILTSDNPGNEPPEQIITEIAAAFEGSQTPYIAIPDRAEAIRQAVKLTESGDILVLAGKGHETYQLIGSEKLPFSDREVLLSQQLHTKQKPSAPTTAESRSTYGST